MRRLLVLGFAALALAGCQNNGNVVDPFVGPTRVEPPRTGSVTNPGDPYYPAVPGGPSYAPAAGASGSWAPASPDAQQPPRSVAPASPAPRPPRTLPAGQHGSSGGAAQQPAFEANRSSSIRIPPPTPAAEGSMRVAAGASGAGSRGVAPSAESIAPAAGASSPRADIAGRTPVTRVIEPRTPAASAAPAASALARAVQPVDLASLPGGSNGGPATSSRTNTNAASAVVPATATSDCGCDAPAEGAVQLASATSDGRYGHDPQYQWLRGQIEYGQGDACWRLRYIPAGSPADSLGGRVILCNAQALSGYERGQFVQVRGRLVQKTSRRGCVTVYEVTEVRAQ